MMLGSAKKPSLGELYDQFFTDFWAESDAWERAAANDDELWSQESDENWERIQRAAQMGYGEAAAFDLHLQGAKAGSVWCQHLVGWHYWTGIGVAADQYLAIQYYRSAICGGSWIATLHYARLLYEVGEYDDCEHVLSDGVNCGFVPSYYWLAWFRHKRQSTRAVREEVRPLVEHAAKAGHPGAKLLLARWMATGKLKLRDIPPGWLMAVKNAIAPGNRKANQ
jgi:TPR repeat protein